MAMVYMWAFGLFMTFFLIAGIPITSTAKISKVDVELRVDPDCRWEKIMHVTEFIQYDFKNDSMIAKRVNANFREVFEFSRMLPSLLDPSNVTVQDGENCEGTELVGIEYTKPGKSTVDYEAAHNMIIKLTTAPDRTQPSFKIKMTYRARLFT